MDHTAAKKIFTDIQARPYRLSQALGQAADNCYFKGIELLQKLGTLGYDVRGRVGETYWDTSIIPADIINLLPAEIQVTHFFVEVLIDGEWRTLDASFQPALAKYGFKIGSWEAGGLCFPITRLYTHEENIAYQQKWADPALQKEFFDKGGPCWRALDAWFAERA